MRLINTRNRYDNILFKNAILNPINNGMWFFPYIPKLQNEFFKKLPNKSFNEISYDICKAFSLDKEIGKNNLIDIIEKSFQFPIINKELKKNLIVSELYHGPSKSFKDFGTSFTANLLQNIKTDDNEINIITATTGDTGSAVANAFYKKKGIKVHILYPKDKISIIQQKQMTTLGDNIRCYAIDGNFDDCQHIVKTLLNDRTIFNLTTCNSVNIGRLLGQIFYYFYICQNSLDKKINISIPTGNMGNGLSCYIAKRMGLPINNIILASNNNSNLSKLLNYENFNLNTECKKTFSNAIDIINPSNYERYNSFINNYNNYNKTKLDSMIPTITNDNETLYMINKIYYKYNYIIDPHTAVAFDGLFNKYNHNRFDLNQHNIVLSTADPSKFYFEIDYKDKFKLSNEITRLLEKKEFIIECSNDINKIKQYII